MSKAVAVILVLGTLVLVAGGLLLLRAGLAVDQPIAFNHRVHLEDLGMECTDCHLYATTAVRATIPNIQTCADCHSEAASDSPAEAAVVQHVETETPIPWRKIYWVPDDVYFSHLRHTAVAGLDCEICHGAIHDREQPLTHALVPISMERCIDCHRQSGATDDCIACHR